MDSKIKALVYGFVLVLASELITYLLMYVQNLYVCGIEFKIISLLFWITCIVGWLSFAVVGYILTKRKDTNKDLIISGAVFGLGVMLASIILIIMQFVLSNSGSEIITNSTFITSTSSLVSYAYHGHSIEKLGSLLLTSVILMWTATIIYLIGGAIKKKF